MAAIDSYQTETSIIGALLIEPNLMGEAALSLREDDFQSGPCRLTWKLMKALFDEGETIDPVIVIHRLRELGGGDDYRRFVLQCMELTPTTAHLRQHMALLKKETMLRRLRECGEELRSCTNLEEAMALVDKAEGFRIQNRARERRSYQQMFASFGERHAQTVTPDFLPWPFRKLSEGIRVGKGKFLIVGGYPSDGKTTFALQCALHQSQRRRRVGFYSFETDADTVEDRMLAGVLGVKLQDIQENRLSEKDWEKYASESAASESPFDLISASGMTVEDIRADALANRYDVIYIDYLQLIEPTHRRAGFSRFDEVSEISRSLQRLAKSTGINVVSLSQMSRPQADKTGNVPPPTMHNLRESGQIEQDADVIMLIYRKEQKNIRAPRYLDVAKNKEGRTGSFEMTFDGEHQRFSMEKPPYSGTRPAQVKDLGKYANKQPEPDPQQSFSLINEPDPDCPYS